MAAPAQAEPTPTGEGAPGVVPLGCAFPTQPVPANPVLPRRPPARYLRTV
ncbi:MAG: hypothetical protein KA777_06315 [Rhodoferax sp.]|nr:hypothetical protein [Rhodoferax sp.]